MLRLVDGDGGWLAERAEREHFGSVFREREEADERKNRGEEDDLLKFFFL